MRRLPIFFVLDCSESMVGDNLKNMETGISMLVNTLRQDPHALETAYLSVIAFAGIARTIAPLIEVTSFYPPKLPVGSGTALGAALNEIMNQMDKQVVKSTLEKKGDWKPLVFLFTDGKPTDSIDKIVQCWKDKYASSASLVAIGIGPYARFDVLKNLTETAFLFKGKNDADFKKLIAWVSASISVQSKSIRESNSDRINLEKPDEKIISFIKDDELPPILADEDCAVIPGRCQKNKKLYLIKYDRNQNVIPFNDEVKLNPHFSLSGCYPMGEEYFEWSSRESEGLSVNTNTLNGIPGCPYCGNISAFAMCRCGKIMCIHGPSEVICPWCHDKITFALGSGEGFDVQRGRG